MVLLPLLLLPLSILEVQIYIVWIRQRLVWSGSIRQERERELSTHHRDSPISAADLYLIFVHS